MKRAEPLANFILNWEVESDSWKNCGFDFRKVGEDAAVKALDYLQMRRLFPSIEISILLADDRELQDLNQRFRAKDKPTNVLSFPVDFPLQSAQDLYLGDIAISYNTLYNECEEQGKTFHDHYCHLVVHSVLHLLGHDHDDKINAGAMEGIEKAVLKNLNIKDPYE